jgi:hypothetical protein
MEIKEGTRVIYMLYSRIECVVESILIIGSNKLIYFLKPIYDDKESLELSDGVWSNRVCIELDSLYYINQRDQKLSNLI